MLSIIISYRKHSRLFIVYTGLLLFAVYQVTTLLFLCYQVYCYSIAINPPSVKHRRQILNMRSPTVRISSLFYSVSKLQKSGIFWDFLYKCQVLSGFQLFSTSATFPQISLHLPLFYVSNNYYEVSKQGIPDKNKITAPVPPLSATSSNSPTNPARKI